MTATASVVPVSARDAINRQILEISEDRIRGFVRDPIAEIARQSGLGVVTVTERIRSMLEAGVIRRVRQTLLATNLAQGALVAWKIDLDRTQDAFRFIAAHDPFSGHVVIRDSETGTSEWRLWTTLKVPRGYSIESHCDYLRKRIGARAYRLMPALRSFVLGVGHMRRKNMKVGEMSPGPAQAMVPSIVDLDERDWNVLTLLKRDFLPEEIGPAMWERRARVAGIDPEAFIAVAQDLDKRGVIGRFSTFLEHTKQVAGEERVASFNGLFHWAVPAGREIEAGCQIGRFGILTHCYWRDAGPELNNVNIMAVAHGETKAGVMAHKAAIDAHLIELGIGFTYTNVYWGSRAEIKPSEISPVAYREWALGSLSESGRPARSDRASRPITHDVAGRDARRLRPGRPLSERLPGRTVGMTDFNVSPFVVIWENTRACDLACRHCRAAAQSRRSQFELTTEQGFHLIDEIALMKPKVFVITGGDPLKREDTFDMIAYAREKGLEPSLTPSATPLLTEEAIVKMKEHGLGRMAVSLDASRADLHDDFRRVSGSFDITLRAIRAAKRLNIPVQVNTTVSRRTIADLPHMVETLQDLGIAMWSVFFLVPTGRAKSADLVSPEEVEELFGFLYETSKRVPFSIRTTEATHYRRYMLQRMSAERGLSLAALRDVSTGLIDASTLFLQHGPRTMPLGIQPGAVSRAPRGVNEGKGFVFISHIGDVFPSGFLPLKAGNVKTESLSDIYQSSELFTLLRDSSRLIGKCGYCEFRDLCGGSRARAWSMTGNVFESDPLCTYQPQVA